jgi:hypothetical protein
MKKINHVVWALCLPLLLQAAEVAVFESDDHVPTNSINQTTNFALDLSAPLISKDTLQGYSGPDVYGAMYMKNALWRVAHSKGSGMSVRFNNSANNWVSGLFLMPVEQIRFSKEHNSMYAMKIFTSQIQRLDTATIRYVIRAGGTFYISEPSSDFSRGGTGNQTDVDLLNVFDAGWFNYDPVSAPESVSTIGTKASPKFKEIDFVGFALFATGAMPGGGVNFGVKSFSVDAVK